jgi:hypothetical protein
MHGRPADGLDRSISSSGLYRRSESVDINIAARVPIIKPMEQDASLDLQIDRMKAAVKIYSIVIAKEKEAKANLIRYFLRWSSIKKPKPAVYQRASFAPFQGTACEEATPSNNEVLSESKIRAFDDLRLGVTSTEDNQIPCQSDLIYSPRTQVEEFSKSLTPVHHELLDRKRPLHR